MADLEVFISNPGHHVATLAPVVEYVAQRGVASRVHSFCELRGFSTPESHLASSGADVVPAWPPWLRRPAGTTGATSEIGTGWRRRVLREMAWRAVIAPRLAKHLDATSRLAVLPNDSAFPYDRLAALLHRRRIPFVLVQEGIRFPLPAERSSRYGLGGARALAVWGDASADHFGSLGIDTARIHVTGAPRFDDRMAAHWPVEREPRQGPAALLLITNPIDAQGFCLPAEKTRLVAQFVSYLGDALRRGAATLTLRPHPGESPEEYSAAMAPSDRALVSFDAAGDLGAALAATDVAIVMASTVGLEALQNGVPLSVLPTPGHGYVHDYVARGAAVGLSLDDSLAAQLIGQASPSEDYSSAVNSYLDYHLANAGQATRNVGQLMIGLLDDE